MKIFNNKLSNLLLTVTLLVILSICSNTSLVESRRISHLIKQQKQQDKFSDCDGAPNTNTIYTRPPTFVRATQNGKRYLAGTGDDTIKLVHVFGSAYEMGKAYGELFKPELSTLIPTFDKYLDDLILNNTHFLDKLPKEWAEYVVEFGIDAALDLNYEFTKSYVPKRFLEELQGIADGSGMSLKSLIRMNYIPEIIQAACSMFGAWGDATKAINGTLLQIRALDWDIHSPVRSCKAMVVYHPTEPGSQAFANIGFCGLIGSITGYSNSSIAISEKVWLGHPENNSRIGKPWTFALRDVLQFATDLDSSLNQLINTQRTCSIHVGIGDSATGEFRGVEYSAKQLNVYNWMTQPVYPQHPRLKQVVYWDKHPQPTHSYCLGALMQKYYGQYDVETAIQIMGMAATGNVQAAVFDFAKNNVYVAYERQDNASGPLFAYQRTFIKFDMTQIFAEKL